MQVVTREGTMSGEPGDWLTIGTKGEPYFCKDDIFRETYEPADEDEAPTRFGGQAKPRRGRRKKEEVSFVDGATDQETLAKARIAIDAMGA